MVLPHKIFFSSVVPMYSVPLFVTRLLRLMVTETVASLYKRKLRRVTVISLLMLVLLLMPLTSACMMWTSWKEVKKQVKPRAISRRKVK